MKYHILEMMDPLMLWNIRNKLKCLDQIGELLLALVPIKAPSTLNRFQAKTVLFCSRYGYRPHYKAENDHRKRSHLKTLSRVERFENDAFWKRCFLVWTVKTMLSDNGDVIQIDTTGRHQRIENGANLPGRYIEMRMRRVHLSMRTEGIKAFSNGYGIVVWTGENDTKTISVDANRFENGAKQLRFRLKTD